jgi:hypothetical protein
VVPNAEPDLETCSVDVTLPSTPDGSCGTGGNISLENRLLAGARDGGGVGARSCTDLLECIEPERVRLCLDVDKRRVISAETRPGGEGKMTVRRMTLAWMAGELSSGVVEGAREGRVPRYGLSDNCREREALPRGGLGAVMDVVRSRVDASGKGEGVVNVSLELRGTEGDVCVHAVDREDVD